MPKPTFLKVPAGAHFAEGKAPRSREARFKVGTYVRMPARGPGAAGEGAQQRAPAVVLGLVEWFDIEPFSDFSAK